MAPFECLSLSHLKFSLIPLQEKEHSIPHDDLGRDVASVTALQRKHEAFENEASALGTQVRVGVAVMARVCLCFLHPSRYISFLLQLPFPCLLSILFLPFLNIHIRFHSLPSYLLSPLPHFAACSLPLVPPLLSLSPLLKVRDLSGEAMRLSALYPGGNAKGIMAKQEVINTAWESLTLAIQSRKKMLRSSLEFQKFLSLVRNY